jgi:phenylpropionate dioxygenase-like ring-hydroxylating dioxygenase large terminal subunit
MPSVPANASYRDTMHVKALLVREWGEMIWVWMGAGDTPPALPQLEFALVPSSHRYVSKKLQQCNWAQACEGALDTTHFTYLHMAVGESESHLMSVLSGAEAGLAKDRARWLKNDGLPVFTVHEHAAGLVMGENYHGQTWVPIDDQSCWIYCYSWNPERALTDEERDKFRAGHSVHATVDEHWVPLRNRSNDYLIDRDLQQRATYTGIQGVSEQDAAIQDSQGLIADRTREHLGPTDLGIVRFRRLVMQSARAVAQGEAPQHAQHSAAYRVRSGGHVAHRDKTFAVVMQERFGDAAGCVHPTEK